MAFLTPDFNGSGDNITGTAPSMSLVKTGAGFTPDVVGKYVTIYGSTTSTNDGHFEITSRPDSDTISYTNASGVAEAVLTWEIVDQSVANDWLRTYCTQTNFTETTEAKVAHSTSPLDTNQLTNAFYASYARSFIRTGGSGKSSIARYMMRELTNPTFIGDTQSQSISCVVRSEGLMNSCGVTLLLRYAGTSLFYAMMFVLDSPFSVRIIGNDNLSDERWLRDEVSKAAQSDVTASFGDWVGIRFVAETVGTNVRLRGYLVKGVTILNSLDPYNEPVWGEPVIDIIHNSGSTTPQLIVADSGGSFGSTTPTLSGDPGFVVSNSDNAGSVYLYVDSVMAKRMTA